MKILLLDIETAPNTVFTWGLRDQNISTNQIVTSGYVMCWAAKWYGQDKVMFRSFKDVGHKRMLREIHSLLSEADVVVHYNGKSFDIPTLNKEFVINRWAPPSPYKQVDLYHQVRNVFRFQSNKLDYITKSLDLGEKIRHEGQELWTKCMDGDGPAWKRMKRYNIGDIVLLERLYDRIKPWIQGHPNHSAFHGDVRCPRCGQKDRMQKRGPAGNKTGTYQRFQCKCGGWARGKITPHKADVLVAQ